MTVIDLHGRQSLPSVARPNKWLVVGWVLQAIGVVVPAAYVVTQAHHESIGGHLTAATVLLAWHGAAHTAVGLTLLISGAVVFAAGSITMARPFVRRPVVLLVAVPIAAIVGMFVLGLIALVVAAMTALAENVDLFDMADVADSGQHTYKRGRRFIRWQRARG
jgi:hypothetical protein